MNVGLQNYLAPSTFSNQSSAPCSFTSTSTAIFAPSTSATSSSESWKSGAPKESSNKTEANVGKARRTRNSATAKSFTSLFPPARKRAKSDSASPKKSSVPLAKRKSKINSDPYSSSPKKIPAKRVLRSNATGSTSDTVPSIEDTLFSNEDTLSAFSLKLRETVCQKLMAQASIASSISTSATSTGNPSTYQSELNTPSASVETSSVALKKMLQELFKDEHFTDTLAAPERVNELNFKRVLHTYVKQYFKPDSDNKVYEKILQSLMDGSDNTALEQMFIETNAILAEMMDQRAKLGQTGEWETLKEGRFLGKQEVIENKITKGGSIQMDMISSSSDGRTVKETSMETDDTQTVNVDDVICLSDDDIIMCDEEKTVKSEPTEDDEIKVVDSKMERNWIIPAFGNKRLHVVLILEETVPRVIGEPKCDREEALEDQKNTEKKTPWKSKKDETRIEPSDLKSTRSVFTMLKSQAKSETTVANSVACEMKAERTNGSNGQTSPSNVRIKVPPVILNKTPTTTSSLIANTPSSAALTTSVAANKTSSTSKFPTAFKTIAKADIIKNAEGLVIGSQFTFANKQSKIYYCERPKEITSVKPNETSASKPAAAKTIPSQRNSKPSQTSPDSVSSPSKSLRAISSIVDEDTPSSSGSSATVVPPVEHSDHNPVKEELASSNLGAWEPANATSNGENASSGKSAQISWNEMLSNNRNGANISSQQKTGYKHTSAGAPSRPPSTEACSRPPSAEACSRPPSAEACSTPPSAEACSRPPSAETSSRPPSAETSSRPPSAEACSRLPSAETSSRPPSAETSSRPPSAETSSRPPSAVTSSRPPSAETSSRPPSAETSSRPPSAETSSRAPSAEASSTPPSAITSSRAQSAGKLNDTSFCISPTLFTLSDDDDNFVSEILSPPPFVEFETNAGKSESSINVPPRNVPHSRSITPAPNVQRTARNKPPLPNNVKHRKRALSLARNVRIPISHVPYRSIQRSTASNVLHGSVPLSSSANCSGFSSDDVIIADDEPNEILSDLMTKRSNAKVNDDDIIILD